MATISLKGIYKKFPGEKARNKPLDAIVNLDLEIPDGKVMAILGPSGCGKTTLLRIIAGLIEPDAGEVLYDNVDVNDVTPGDRKIGIVFQNYALYPTYTSKTNILSYFFFKKRTPELTELEKERFRITSELMGVEIEHLLSRKPPTLSGGEKQCVAIARCITREPRLFLLDEPFANLDQHLREKYRVKLKELLNHFSITAVYVTHDQQEAHILGDLVSIMNQGRIVQIGTAKEIYLAPASLFVAEFLNPLSETPAINLCEGRFVADEYRGTTLGVRPEDIILSDEAGVGLSIPAAVTGSHDLSFRSACVMTVDLNGTVFSAESQTGSVFPQGKKVWIRFARLHVFDKASGERIRTVETQTKS
jgi:ABC-type sugar transport system ATPase subunit